MALERLATSARETQNDAVERAQALGAILSRHVKILNQDRHYWRPLSEDKDATTGEVMEHHTDGAAATWIIPTVEATLTFSVDPAHKEHFDSPNWLPNFHAARLELEQLPMPHTSYIGGAPTGEFSYIDLARTSTLDTDAPTGTGDLCMAMFVETGTPLSGDETQTVIGALSLMLPVEGSSRILPR